MNLRPFTDADYDALLDIDRRAWPGEPIWKEGLLYDDATWDTAYFRERVFVEVEGQRVAYAEYSETPWAYEPDKYFLKIMVPPEHQGKGIGGFLYRHISEKLSTRGAKWFSATTREDQPRAIRFLEARGFRQVIREIESRLEVQRFDRAAFAPLLARVEGSGIAIHSIRQMARTEPDWVRKWWELKWAIVPDIPTSEAFTPESLEDFEDELESPYIDLDAAFVAIDTTTGEWVGMSSVEVYPEDRATLYVGLTGVRRAYRRRGIALALKVQTVDFAAAHGAHVIIAENEEHNPMYALNKQVGFRYRTAWLGFEKRW